MFSWLAGLPACWLAGLLAGWLAGLLVCWLAGLLAGWLAGWLLAGLLQAGTQDGYFMIPGVQFGGLEITFGIHFGGLEGAWMYI